jgi:RNA polymerase sigma-70 factor (ECF subfamily)
VRWTTSSMRWRTPDTPTRIDTQFCSLFLSHYDDVLGYCVRRTTFSEAEDAASEVFAIAWRRIDDLEWDTAAPWLFGIARGVLSNQRRSASRRTRLTRKVGSMGEGQVEALDVVVIRREQDQQVMDVLEGLRETDSEILMLSTWEELSAPEIATALDISVSAAEQRLHRAKQRFALALKRISPQISPDTAQEGGHR